METVTILADWLNLREGMEPYMAALAAVTIIALLWSSYTDLRSMVIPNYVSEGGIVVGLLTAPLLFTDWATHILAGVVCALVFLPLVFVKVRGQHAFGAGDAKLYVALGLAVGPAVALTIFGAALLGMITGVILILATGRNQPFPHGPQIAVAHIALLLTTAF